MAVALFNAREMELVWSSCKPTNIKCVITRLGSFNNFSLFNIETIQNELHSSKTNNANVHITFFPDRVYSRLFGVALITNEHNDAESTKIF